MNRSAAGLSADATAKTSAIEQLNGRNLATSLFRRGSAARLEGWEAATPGRAERSLIGRSDRASPWVARILSNTFLLGGEGADGARPGGLEVVRPLILTRTSLSVGSGVGAFEEAGSNLPLGFRL